MSILTKLSSHIKIRYEKYRKPNEVLGLRYFSQTYF